MSSNVFEANRRILVFMSREELKETSDLLRGLTLKRDHFCQEVGARRQKNTLPVFIERKLLDV